jgi:TatD DNase family protein
VAGWTDSHCHLQDRFIERDGSPGRDDADELDDLLARAAAAGVSRAVVVGTNVETSAAAVELAGRDGFPVGLAATVGLHPHEASSTTRGLGALLDAPGAERIVAIGECGLDYFYEHSPRNAQLEVLAEQVRLAVDRDLALVLHVRDAFDDLFGLLGEVGVPERVIVHCFTGGPNEVRTCLDLGMAVSISGIVTFKNAVELRDAVALIPLDRLLVETDSPFLAPVPMRGRANEPGFVPLVGDAVAAILGRPVEEVRDATSATATTWFRLTHPA